MNPIIDRCAGLDVHQATVMATVRIPDEAGGRRIITEKFATTTVALLTMRDWLHAQGVTHVAMESTGVYWKPVYYVLEDAFTLLLVNVQQLKQVRDANRMCATAPGSHNCWSGACCAAVWSCPRRCGTCAN